MYLDMHYVGEETNGLSDPALTADPALTSKVFETTHLHLQDQIFRMHQTLESMQRQIITQNTPQVSADLKLDNETNTTDEYQPFTNLQRWVFP